jgi:uncharacterized membrane protein YeaQ/YmgE (transglycosylase-associated protein family)
MNILAFLMVGLCSGFLAGRIVEGQGFGVIGDIIIGMIGAFISGFFFTSLHPESFGGAVLTSTLGAVIFLVMAGFFRAITQPRARV